MYEIASQAFIIVLDYRQLGQRGEMPIFCLNVMARTENVESIVIPQDYKWQVRIKCSSCNETFPKVVGVSKLQEEEMDKQHGVANFSIKCKNCSRKGYITVLETSTYKVQPNQDGMVKGAIAYFQCRGLEMIEVLIGDYFTVHAKGSDTVFESADFSDLWAQYDEKTSKVAQVEDPKLDLILFKAK